jgi:hypothetical protein
MDEETIRHHAYQLWESAGCPSGRDEEFWEKAKELAAIDENQRLTTKPVPEAGEQPWGQPVEPAIVVENQGDFPGRADQGEEQLGVPGRGRGN